MKIDAYVVDAVHAPFVREELELEAPGPGEVLVRVVGTGVCHTDLNTQSGDMPLPLPGVLGHEGSGVVEAVGEGITYVVPGDHVIMAWPYCGECRNCLRGEHRYCERIGEALCGGHRLRGPQAGSTRTHGEAMVKCRLPLDLFLGDWCRVAVTDAQGKRAWTSVLNLS